MTGPKLGAGGWKPVACPQCGATPPTQAPAAAVAWLEAHLTEEHGAEL